MAKKYNINNARKERSNQENSSFENLFGDDFGNDIFTDGAKVKALKSLSEEIKIDKLVESPRNPYKVIDNDEMDALVASIKREGILIPIIARPVKGDKYEIISGHRRTFAAKKLGMKTIPAVIKEMTDEQADVRLVDYNLNREKVLPSEKAKAVALKYNAIKRIAGVKGANNMDEEAGHNSQQIIAEQMGESGRNLRRYLLFNNLCENIMDKVDNGQMQQVVAEQFAHLDEETQIVLDKVICEDNLKISLNTAKEIRSAFEKKNDVTESQIRAILTKKTKAIPKVGTVIKKAHKQLLYGQIDTKVSAKEKETIIKEINEIRRELDAIETKLN